MARTRRVVAISLAVMAAWFGLGTPANAFRLPAVTDKPTLQECTACHMIFPPQMLPARSWDKLLGSLDKHFNENATLDDKTRAAILSYLDANAADAPANRRITGLLRGVSTADVPLRITDMPWWVSIHGQRSSRWFQDPRVKSAANCVACHQGADKGYFQGD